MDTDTSVKVNLLDMLKKSSAKNAVATEKAEKNLKGHHSYVNCPDDDPNSKKSPKKDVSGQNTMRSSKEGSLNQTGAPPSSG